MSELPKVILLLETSIEYGRALLRGVSRYERLHEPWLLQVEPGHFQHILPQISPSEKHGIIARITSVEDAVAIGKAPCPVVVLGASYNDPAIAGACRSFHEVLTDSPTIAKVAAEHLKGLGLVHFAFCGFSDCPWSELRRKVFTSYLEDSGFSCSAFTEQEKGGGGGHGLLESKQLIAWLESLPKPVGLMACNDTCGRQVLAACSEIGIAVPDQVAVVGVDNDELICELAHPSLSSVALDVEQAGYDAAKLLDALMSGWEPPERQISKVQTLEVVGRRSTQPIIEDNPQVAEALRFIRDHAGSLTGVPDVSEYVGVSRRSLERAFNQSLGYGVYEEITRCRLLRAKRLLQETNLTASRVAESAGFGSVQPMMRLFRQREGCTPLEYRQQQVQD